MVYMSDSRQNMRNLTRLLISALLAGSAGVGAGCQGDAATGTSDLSMQTAGIYRTGQGVWETPYGTGAVLSTDHYKIWTTLPEHSRLRKALPGFLEAARANYLQLTGLGDGDRRQPMPVYVLADRTQWDHLTRHRMNRSVQIETGGYTADGVCVFWDIGPLHTLSVAAHEGLHQFFYHRLRERNPMWLEEGLCATAEGFEITDRGVVFTPDRNNSRFSDLRQTITRGYWKPLEELLKMHSMDAAREGFSEKAVGYYGQLWALMHMIRHTPRYRAGMERLLADASAGRFHTVLGVSRRQLHRMRRNPLTYNRAVSLPLFRHYINDDLEAFQAEYRAYAENLVGG